MDGIVPPFQPSFYKILTHLNPTLELPVGFTNKYREILPERAKLRLASGAKRVVSVEQLADDDRFYFTSGWAAFSRDMKLRLHEILVFSYVGNSTFQVCAYAVTAVEKQSNFRPVFADPSESSSSGSSSESVSASSESDPEPDCPRKPRLKVVLTPAYRYRLNVPLGVGEAWGLMGRVRVRLEYRSGGGGQSGEAAVVQKLWRGRMMIHLSTGWREFCKANGMAMGKAYSLNFLPALNVIRVHRIPRNTCFRRRR